jgi:hypothetical protein
MQRGRKFRCITAVKLVLLMREVPHQAMIINRLLIIDEIG